MTLIYIKEEEDQHLNDQHLMVIGIQGNPPEGFNVF